MNPSDQPAARSGTVLIGGDLPVHRLGFGAMRITGPGIWGPPADRAGALAVLRLTVELGITLIDTADSYGLDAVIDCAGAPEFIRTGFELLSTAAHYTAVGLVGDRIDIPPLPAGGP